MEEDAGKSLHVGGATGRIHGADYSLLDYNRAGVPLIEIVTQPIVGAGVRAPEVAKAYVVDAARHRQGPRHLRRADGAGLDALRRERLAARPTGATELGTRTETKNVNSLRSVERAVRYEIQRQAAILAAGGTITQETRHWTRTAGTTSRRPREGDAGRLPLLPRARPRADRAVAELDRGAAGGAARAAVGAPRALQADWGFTDEELRDLVNAGRARPRRRHRRRGRAARSPARSWWVAYLAQQANTRGVALTELAITPAHVARVIALVADGTLTDQARPPGRRGRPRRRGLAGRRRRRARPRGRLRRLGAHRRHRRGPRRAARRAEKIRDGKTQAAGRDRRRGHEGHPRAGRRRSGAVAGARAGRRLVLDRLRPASKGPVSHPVGDGALRVPDRDDHRRGTRE